MAEDDYTESESPKTAPKKKGTIFGLPYIEVGIIAVVGVVIAIYIKDHMLGGSGSPTYTIGSNGTSPAVTSSGGGTTSSGSTSTSTISSWVQKAMNFANSLGMNQSTVNSALENYTAGNQVTNPAQLTALHAIINAIGGAPGIGSPKTGSSSGGTSTYTHIQTWADYLAARKSGEAVYIQKTPGIFSLFTGTQDNSGAALYTLGTSSGSSPSSGSTSGSVTINGIYYPAGSLDRGAGHAHQPSSGSTSGTSTNG
jgi:hypothetical protein